MNFQLLLTRVSGGGLLLLPVMAGRKDDNSISIKLDLVYRALKRWFSTKLEPVGLQFFLTKT